MISKKGRNIVRDRPTVSERFRPNGQDRQTLTPFPLHSTAPHLDVEVFSNKLSETTVVLQALSVVTYYMAGLDESSS